MRVAYGMDVRTICLATMHPPNPLLLLLTWLPPPADPNRLAGMRAAYGMDARTTCLTTMLLAPDAAAAAVHVFASPPIADPHRLVGMRVAITQEDDSTLEGMVVDYNADDNTHFVICNLGTPDEAGDALPLVEYPDACQVRNSAMPSHIAC
jgi:hypothetical protein